MAWIDDLVDEAIEAAEAAIDREVAELRADCLKAGKDFRLPNSQRRLFWDRLAEAARKKAGEV